MQRPVDPHAPTGWSLSGLALSLLVSSLGTSIANAALPTMARDFDASFHQVQGVVVAYLLGVTATIVGAGHLGDRYGRRRMLVGGLLLFAGASLVSGLSPALWLVIAARAAQGVGAAFLMALALAFVGDVVPQERTGRAMGWLGTTSAIGTALGPSLGGLLTDAFGWRAIFLGTAPLAIVALLLVVRHLPQDRVHDRPAFDLVGTLRSLLRDPGLVAGLAMNLLVSAVAMTTLVVGPFYLSLALGLEAGAVGMVLSVGPLVAALAGAPAGRLVDRLGAHRTTLAGLVGIVAGASILAASPGSLGIAGYVVPVAAITASYALFQAANNTAVLKGVGADRRGVASGVLTLSRNLGLVTGASAMGAVFAWASRSEDLLTAPADHVAIGMRVTFAVAASWITVALGIALARPATHPTVRTSP